MTDLDAAVAAARAAYAQARPASAALDARARQVLPGGNTRSVLDFEPFPFRVAAVDGAELIDVDGHRYVDLLGNYTAGLLGHRPQAVAAAVGETLERGWSLGAMEASDVELAELVCGRFRSIQQVRFTNSGTEANLMAIAAATNFTGRERVLVFDGGYHGGVLYFGQAGRPLNVPHHFLVAPYNDPASVDAVFADNSGEVACVLVEPMMGAGGCIRGTDEFHASLRERCDRSGALLIFDEVMTSRLSPGGAQQLLGITPDLTTLGKYVGGGMTFGAFGGRRDVMAQFDPTSGGGLTHGGTFNNNEVTMAAGVAALGEVLTSDALAAVNDRGDALRVELGSILAASAVPMSVTGWGSMLNVHATPFPVERPADRDEADDRLLELFFLSMLARGFYLARRGFIALSLDVTAEQIEAFLSAVRQWARAAPAH